jgi:O-antigen/teichoic acid export membrane protein
MSRPTSNSIALAVALVGTTLASLLTVKVLSNSLGSTEYGRYGTALAFSNIMSLFFEWGATRVIARYVAHYEAVNQRSATLGMVWLFYGLTVACGTAFVGALILGLDRVIALGLYHDEGLTLPLVLAVSLTAIITLINLTAAAFSGRQQMVISSALSLGIVAIPASIYLALASRLSVETALEIGLASDVVVLLISGPLLQASLLRGQARQIAIHPLKVAGNVGPYWRSAAALTLLSLLFNYSDRLIISVALPTQFVAFYNIANNIHLMSKRVLAIPLGAVAPVLTTAWSQNQQQRVARTGWLVAKYTFMAGMLFTILLVALAPSFVILISNRDYLAAVPVLVLLTASIPLLSITAPMSTTLQAIGIMRPVVIAETAYIGAYVVLNVLLITPFGINGIALSQLIATGGVCAIYMTLLSRYVAFHFSWRDLVRISASAVITALVLLTSHSVIGGLDPILDLALNIPLCCLVYYVLLVVSNSMSVEDRDELARLSPWLWLSRVIVLAYDIPRKLVKQSSVV